MAFRDHRGTRESHTFLLSLPGKETKARGGGHDLPEEVNETLVAPRLKLGDPNSPPVAVSRQALILTQMAGRN